HLAAPAHVLHTAEERQRPGITVERQDRDRARLRQRLEPDHPGGDRVAREVAGQERVVAAPPAAGHHAFARHELVHRGDAAERGSVRQQVDRITARPGPVADHAPPPAPSPPSPASPSSPGPAAVWSAAAEPEARASRDARASSAERATAWAPPSTWTISPVVAGNQSDSSATQARATGSGSRTSQPSGARLPQASSIAAKWGIERAASVRSGPAATRFTRTRCGPTSRAR